MVGSIEDAKLTETELEAMAHNTKVEVAEAQWKKVVNWVIGDNIIRAGKYAAMSERLLCESS